MRYKPTGSGTNLTIDEAIDHYPYGKILRHYSAAMAQRRYRYQGSEVEDGKGLGNAYYTHFRTLDADLARWRQIDPVFQPGESPYVSMGSNPIRFNDPRGDMPPDKILHDDNGGPDRYVPDANGKEFITEEWGHYTNAEKTGFVSRISITPEDRRNQARMVERMARSNAYSRNIGRSMDQFEAGFAGAALVIAAAPLSIPTLGSGGVSSFLAGSALRSSLDLAAQAAAYNGDMSKLDVGDAMMSGFLTPGGSAALGGAFDFRPFSETKFRMVGVNKGFAEGVFDGSAKFIFGRSGPIGRQYNKLGSEFSKIGSGIMAPLITSPFNAAGKIVTKETKGAVFGD